MPHDPDIAKAYREMRIARGWVKERTTRRWQLAAAAVTNHLPLNGPAVLKHATNTANVGKRSIVKKPT